MKRSPMDEILGVRPKKTWHVSNKFFHFDIEDDGSIWIGIVVIALWIFAIILSAVAAGALLYLGNYVEMVHRLYEHFNIAGLSFKNYCTGAIVLALILYMLIPTGSSNKNNKQNQKD